MKLRIFQTDGPAIYRFRTRFSGVSFANVTFFDADLSCIPFHLSLRPEDGIVSLNDRTNCGWGEEIHLSATFAKDGDTVEIRFFGRDVEVHVNRTLLELTHQTRMRFSNTDRIVFAEAHGAVVPATIDIDTHLPGETTDKPLLLSRRLQVRARPGLLSEPMRLHVSGLENCIEIDERPEQGRATTLLTTLPGRIWAGGRRRVDIHLATSVGELAYRMHIRRSELLNRVRDILAAGELRGDPVLTATVAEHVNHARLLSVLPPDMSQVLVRAVQAANLPHFLDLSGAKFPSAPSRRYAPRRSLDRAINHVSACLDRDASAEDLRSALDKSDLTEPEKRKLILSLVEPFCVLSDVKILAEWASTTLAECFEPTPDPWHNSAILPFLFCDGRLDEVGKILGSLSEGTETRLVMPAIAWVVQEVFQSFDPQHPKCIMVLDAFVDFMTAQAHCYWAHTSCEKLLSAVAGIVAGLERVPEDLAHRLTAMLIQVFGVSKPFWDRLQKPNLKLPVALRAARLAAVSVENARRNPGNASCAAVAERGLAWLEAQGCIDAKRVRRDLFGPAAFPMDRGCRLPSPDEFVLRGQGSAEALIRAAAFPLAPPLSRHQASFCAENLHRFDPTVPAAPRADLLSRTSSAVREILDSANDRVPEEVEQNLLALAHAETKHAGVSLALGLTTSAWGTPLGDSALVLLQTMLFSLSGSERENLTCSPAVQAALETLAQRPELANRLRGLLPELNNMPTLATSPLSACALHNAVILVFTCRANLDSVVAALRNGWVRDAKALGIPHLFVVGSGKGVIRGDVLELNAPDDYEGLPDKMLAALTWVQRRTGYSHMVKVDDDCFLDVPAYFDSYGYRLADYFGRPLTRTEGQTDRAWHMARASSARGRRELDKSPEPSTYADGGCGYALSRTAICAALHEAAKPEGRHLRRVSFMEDKLLGDLLDLAGIPLVNDNYLVSVRRRSRQGGRPVARWVNGFWPSAAAPVKLVHMDTHEGHEEVARCRRARRLTPSKIWPSFQDVRLGYQSNALELVGPISRVEGANDAPVSVVSCVRNEIFMLPHFLRHYRGLGVQSFLIADNGSEDGTLEYLADQHDVALFTVDTDYREAGFGVAWQQAMLSAFRTGKWSLVADADEFLVWRSSGQGSLPDLLAGEGFEAADAVRLFMLDMYPRGSISDADFKAEDPFAATGYVDRVPFRTSWPGRGPFSNARTWTSALRHRLIPGPRPDMFVAQKLALLRYNPWMRLSEGLHYGSGMTVAQRELLFGHFKYNADFHRKVEAEIARGQHFNNAEEYRSYAARLHAGRDVIHDRRISVPWTACDFVRERLDTTGISGLTKLSPSRGMDSKEERSCHSTRLSTRSLTTMSSSTRR